MDWLLLAIFIAAAVLLAFAKSATGPTNQFNYRLRENVLSKAERSFYEVLKRALPAERVLLVKVRVADIISPAKGLNRSNWQKAFNRISAKHFDYVVCHRDSMKVDLVIELDDKSHKARSRQRRDAFLKLACESAGLPLKRFKASKGYRPSEVRERLFGSNV